MLDDLFAKLFPKKPELPGGPVEFIIAGLGNPGTEYEITRHNAGFLAIDRIAQKYGAAVNRVKFKSYSGEAVIAGKKALLLKPATYMNKSGEAIVEALGFYKLPIESLLVIYDEIALPVGTLRIRREGSSGGQKGMENIIYLTGKDNFPRVRIGVGDKPHPDFPLKDWVLSRFTEKENEVMQTAFDHAAQAAQLIVSGDITGAMNQFNKRHVGPKPKAVSEDNA
ncbi:MAG: aminoacyl-tRNA hydrolase [Oscillospiraceae bacterium]|nr:aminoacyl-tRNA hydrolase [Oscillospiraceae bacterium]